MLGKSFAIIFLSFVLSAPFMQLQASAQDLKKYHYDRTVSPEEDEPEGHLMDRKKKKGKKPTPQPPAQFQDPPACIPPECVIQDPILPDEICNNDCPQGSGRHCQGRHNMFTHELYAVCVSD